MSRGMNVTDTAGTPNSVFNQSWQGLATEKGVDRASATITKAVADVGKDAKRVADAVKAGSDKIVDAVGKIKATSNAEETAALTPAVKAVCQGLLDVSESTAQLAEHFLSHPSEWESVGEQGEKVNEQFAELVRSVKHCADGREQLRMATTEIAKNSQWGSENSPCGGGNQCISVGNRSFGNVVGSFDALR